MAKKSILFFLLIILILTIISIYYPQIQNLTGNVVKNDYYDKESAILTRVVDGDTIHALVNGKDETIRLLGINTPEKNMPHANSASEFLKQYINKTITLVRDKEDTDKYNRKLRYAYYKDQFLEIEILEKGYANSYYTKDLIYEQELLNAEKQARNNELGIWEKSNEKCASENCIKLEKLEPQKEFFILLNICSFECEMTSWFVKDAGRNTFYLTGLNSNQEKTYSSKEGAEVWNNDHDKFFMFDKQGLLVLYYEY